MNSLQVKKAIFNSTEIVFLRKNGNITVSIEDIERIEYSKPTLINYLLASTWFGGTYPGRLQIHLNKRVNNTKLYLVKLKHKELSELPEFYIKKVDPTNKWGFYQ